MAKIIGRQEEVSELQSLLSMDSSTFVAVYGRRRVGKTFLIRNVYDNQFTFHITGLGNVDMSHQLINFQAALVNYFPDCEDQPIATTWFQAFQQLIKALEKLPNTAKKTLFFDELPWFDTPNSFFISSLEHFWNSWASARSDINLVDTGSIV